MAVAASSGTFAAKPREKREREAYPVSAADEEESHRKAQRQSTDTTLTGETGRPDAAMPTTTAIVTSAASGQAAAKKTQSTLAGFSSYAASASTSATVAKPDDKTAAEEDSTNKVAAMDCSEAYREDIEVSQRGSWGGTYILCVSASLLVFVCGYIISLCVYICIHL
jgi:hypothetical protein